MRKILIALILTMSAFIYADEFKYKNGRTVKYTRMKVARKSGNIVFKVKGKMHYQGLSSKNVVLSTLPKEFRIALYKNAKAELTSVIVALNKKDYYNARQKLNLFNIHYDPNDYGSSLAKVHKRIMAKKDFIEKKFRKASDSKRKREDKARALAKKKRKDAYLAKVKAATTWSDSERDKLAKKKGFKLSLSDAVESACSIYGMRVTGQITYSTEKSMIYDNTTQYNVKVPCDAVNKGGYHRSGTVKLYIMYVDKRYYGLSPRTTPRFQ